LGDPALSKSIKGAVLHVQKVAENLKVMISSKEEVAQSLKNLPELLKKLEPASRTSRKSQTRPAGS
jgi:hypothetical protein